jgi:uncharacterized protein YecE (DUF72 family)
VGEQLDLFGQPATAGGLAPATPEPELVRLGAALSRRVYLGTSSWSFPGWRGLVYRDEHSEQILARRGLTAYVRHPLFRSVGIDRTHYATIAAEAFAAYARDVPDGFRFLTKAHEACSLAVFPSHARYGAERGQKNRFFLDPAYAQDLVIGPWAAGLGASAGPLVFQFAAQSMPHLGGTPRRFAERVYKFLRALPPGNLYAIEIRNASLLTKDYAAALRAADAVIRTGDRGGVVHCVNLMPGMPPPITQWRAVVGDGPMPAALVVRWNLGPHRDYETARAAFAPFDRLVEPDHRARADVAALVTAATRASVPAWVIVNNKAEGSSPLSVAALAHELVDGNAPPF